MYPCADGATPLPGICGWRHILRTANFVDVAQEAIETGLSSTLPPAVRHHTGYHPNYFLLGFRAQFPPQKDHLLASFKGRWAPQAGLQDPPGAPTSRDLQGLQEPIQGHLAGLHPVASRAAGPRKRGLFPSRGKSMYIVCIWPTGMA